MSNDDIFRLWAIPLTIIIGLVMYCNDTNKRDNKAIRDKLNDVKVEQSQEVEQPIMR